MNDLAPPGSQASDPCKSFDWPVRVYYEDTDAGGVVYYANYLKYLERARTEWLRALGFEQDALLGRDIVFAVRRVAIDYRHPARFNQWLVVRSRITEVGRARLVFDQRVLHDEATLVTARVQVACLSASAFRPRPLPDDLREGVLSVC